MRRFLNHRGETIAETVIALTVVAIGISLSTALMASSLKNINVSKSRVIAVSIAREGIEAVRNIRDTNWLKFSGKRRLCWNHMPQPSAKDQCEDTDNPLITPGDYIVYEDVDERWRLAPSQIGATDLTPLYTVDIDPTVDTDGDGKKDNDADMYNHIRTNADPTQEDALGKDHAKETFFKRKITIIYLQNDGTPIDTLAKWGTANQDALNRIRVTCLVTWPGSETGVELKTELTDYYGRENLEN